MPQYKTSQVLPYTPCHLYDLVMDVESYPQFVPGCVHARILQRTADEMWAEMTLGKGFLALNYTSHVTCIPHQWVRATLAQGPLKSLDTLWVFYELENERTQIDFALEMTFHAAWKNHLLDHQIHTLGTMMVHAFQERASQTLGYEDNCHPRT